MNVGIGKEAAQFHLAEYLFQIFVTVSWQCLSLTGAAQLRASGNASCLLLAATQPVLTKYDSRPLYVLLLNE
jgi:hypothetical protein